MKFRLLFRSLAVLAAFAVATPALAEFISLPVKWSQPIGCLVPDTIGVPPSPLIPTSSAVPACPTGPLGLPGLIAGVDLPSDHTVGLGGPIMADDFTSDGRPIVAVRWWGSYAGETAPRRTGFTGPFDISFHLSVFPLPPLPPHPLSTPGPLLRLYTGIVAQEEFVGLDIALNPVYRYDAFLPEPFPEEAGVEYFLDIDKPTGEGWGWHEAAFPAPIDTLLIQDCAAVSVTGHAGPWLPFPTTQCTSDLAFELMTVPEPASVALLGLGLLGLGFTLRKRA